MTPSLRSRWPRLPEKWKLRGGSLRWSPLMVLVAWGLVAGFQGRLQLNLSAVLLAGAIWAAALFALRLWPLPLIIVCLLAPMAWATAWQTPNLVETLQQSAGSYLRVRGVVRGTQSTARMRVRDFKVSLGAVSISTEGAQFHLPEARVVLRQPRTRIPPRYRQEMAAGGMLESITLRNGAPEITLSDATWTTLAQPIDPGGGEVLRTRLWDRAGYYLSNAALAAYGPILLAVRAQISPEGREVVKQVRRTGVSHLLAISGLHIGLMFALLLTATRWTTRWGMQGQGWVHSGSWIRVGAMAAIWGYIALIGFPVPAVRAACMGSMVVWGELWGTRSSRLYALGLTALVLMLPDPSLFYDISFQLSFGAYFFLIWALDTSWNFQRWRHREQEGPKPWWVRVIFGATVNVWITFAITLGLWPVISHYFANISLLVFLGNLVLVPLLAVLVLPVGLLALLTSLVFINQIPGGMMERSVFWILEQTLTFWLTLIDLMESHAEELIISYRAQWPSEVFFLYYALIAIFFLGIHRFFQKKVPEF